MKRTYFLLFGVFMVSNLLAQTPTVPEQDSKKLTLEERFQALKTKAESYQDYKVIKAVTLDAEWKIFMDSIRANKAIWMDARKSLANQQTEIKNSQDALKEKEASMSDINFASTHFSFAGISFSKGTFAAIFVVLIASLGIVVALLAAKLKLMSSSIREKADLAEVTMREFEEYKHKALEKQTKLSRELQNERNKIAEMRHN